MSQKTIKRILFGVIGVVFLVLAGHEFVNAGVSADSVLSGGAGTILLYMAITGPG